MLFGQGYSRAFRGVVWSMVFRECCVVNGIPAMLCGQGYSGVLCGQGYSEVLCGQ